MGVTIGSKNYSCDLGYGGFGNFREKVAELASAEFGKHYSSLSEPGVMFLTGGERKKYFSVYNVKTQSLVDNGFVTDEIANFCYQSDCDGKIDKEQASQIYEKIKDYDDDICYGYAGRNDCAMFKDLKQIFKDCTDNGGCVEWS